jgi:histidine triad (HIT) family protein
MSTFEPGTELTMLEAKLGRLDAVDECVFCMIVAGELPSVRLHEDERTIAILDIHPAAPGHALVIPRAHAADIHEIDPDDLAAAGRTAKRIAGLARTKLSADGVTIMQSNGEAAWQTVFHFHIHVIPRRAGDPLVLPWVPDPAVTPAEQLDSIRQTYLAD